MFLVLYDPASGKFLDKKGPWESGAGFSLFANSSGAFVVYLGAFQDQTHFMPGRLLLLSPSGEEIKQSVLDLGDNPGQGILVMHSPSLRTILVIAERSGENHYRVLESENLEARADWVEASPPQAPRVIDISDQEFLGLSNRAVFSVREFRSDWNTLLTYTQNITHRQADELRPNAPFFLRDNVLVGRLYETKDEFVAPILAKDGTVLSLKATKRLSGYNYLRPTIASPDGQFFCLLLMHEKQLTYWLDSHADMQPAGASYFLYVWKAGSTEAPWRIETRGYFTSMCFLQPDRVIALVDGDRLKVFSLPESVASANTLLP